MSIAKKVLGIGLVVLISIFLFFVIYPEILFDLSAWKTQEVIFRHNNDQNHRIEFQMQDRGAVGINRRIVEVQTYFFIDFANKIDTSKIDKSNWQKVDEYVNELGLKFE
ncbi:hypothetical protein [Chondrinema litorale]|uniref:hypothetical protein n=1 Tax=Chondrinema litorale TaxID=2994555 RepID=UPI002543869D|nr:hypothetical protein [Chondrinema litorale]UZR98167.1 hypothetical protein OQ292_29655 [Chondrinema litorale]